MTKEKLLKIGKGALFAIGGALTGYLGTVVVPDLQAEGSLMLATLASIVYSAAEKYFRKG